MTTTTGSESIVPKVDPTLLDTLYNQSILSKLGVKVIQIPSGTNEYRKVRIDDATTQDRLANQKQLILMKET